jgi:tight adherence protein C
MAAIFILGIVLLGASVAFVVRAFMTSGAAAQTVDRIGRYGFLGTSADLPEGEEREPVLSRLASSVGEWMSGHLSWLNEEELRLRLLRAGMYKTTPAKLLGYQLILAVTLLCLWIWLGAVAGYGDFGLALGAVIAVAIGWSIPAGYVWARKRERYEEIEYSMPEMIDLLVVSVEAGLSLPAALRIASRELGGPLGEELRLTLQEQNLGLSGRDSLENLAIRADTPSMKIFVRGIIQGETLGMSIGQVMRNLALEMRKRRKAAAEERAQKAPIKMIFPLVFLIFPAMFVVLLLPALLNIANYFK